MFFKVVFLVALASAVSAQHAMSSQHLHKHEGHAQLVHDGHKHYDYYSHPKYEFEYKVDDPHTHDHKIQHEKRDGHHVENVYSVHTKHKHGDSYASVKRYVDHVVPVKSITITIKNVVLLVALVSAVTAQHATSSQHLHKHEGHAQLVHDGHKHYDYYSHPKYEFEYKVDDPHTHDHKIQHEKRDGHHVENVYSVHTKHKHGDSYASVKRYVDHVVPVEIHHHHH